jgi:hypothetical protein
LINLNREKPFQKDLEGFLGMAKIVDHTGNKILEKDFDILLAGWSYKKYGK